jgi:hypothetical protein
MLLGMIEGARAYSFIHANYPDLATKRLGPLWLISHGDGPPDPALAAQKQRIRDLWWFVWTVFLSLPFGALVPKG